MLSHQYFPTPSALFFHSTKQEARLIISIYLRLLSLDLFSNGGRYTNKTVLEIILQAIIWGVSEASVILLIRGKRKTKFIVSDLTCWHNNEQTFGLLWNKLCTQTPWRNTPFEFISGKKVLNNLFTFLQNYCTNSNAVFIKIRIVLKRFVDTNAESFN